MGRATRWLRGLLGGTKKQVKGAAGQKPPSNSAADLEEQQAQPQGKEKKRRSLNKTDDVEAVRPECSRWVSTNNDRDKERDAGRRAVSADAAEVVRSTGCGRGRERPERGVVVALRFGRRVEWWAAVSIQTAFRGFLARKALRALKALVKLQALVRGYLVRKQAAATLHSMEALIRAQVAVRMHKYGVLLPKSTSYRVDDVVHPKDIRHYPHEIRPRRSLERLDDIRSESATASFHSRRMSANLDHASSGFDDSPRIVEVDTGRPSCGLRNTRRTSDCVNPPPTPSEEYSTTDDTLQSRSSPLTIHTPPSRIATPTASTDWDQLDQQCHRRSLPATAHSTPRLLPRASPAKSASGWSDVVRPHRWEHRHELQYPTQQHHQINGAHPRFMAGTQSSKAKERSQSAPKQRPDTSRRLTLNEMVEARASLSGVRMQRSCSRAHQLDSAKGGGGPTATPVPRSCELGKGAYEREFERRW